MTTPALPPPPDLLDGATQRFRRADRFAYHYARGKLGGDVIFAELLRQGLLPATPRLLDLGCGQGSLFAWLLAAAELHAAGRWPADWPTPPAPVQMRGIELMPRDVWRAAQAFGGAHPQVRVEQGDMNHVDFGQCDVITILDALHYFDHERQREVLMRIRKALAPGGRFITRVGDAASGLPFRLSNWVDHAVTFTRGHRLPRLYCRPLAGWKALLTDVGFDVRSQSMSGRLPFANVLLVCDMRPRPADAPAGHAAPEVSEALA
ncbi:methyltransferase type 11 [Melaminivora suipulveris]|uniref:Methyltransferase type 11 n=1 Tax=Melaminivora suipulveris TaxID=2109913 RepID=A0A2R3QBZ3_9BURK|nr:class I SAM-dependent methyltransferase [Melaminivora suipulveris]AVO49306.1 methyltransferase type 11 [Melaminivora suipulveris]